MFNYKYAVCQFMVNKQKYQFMIKFADICKAEITEKLNMIIECGQLAVKNLIISCNLKLLFI